MCCFFFNDTATTEIYTLSLHDALPISATIENPTAVPKYNVKVIIVVLGSSGQSNNVIAASQTIVPSILPQGSVPIAFTWNTPFSNTPIREEILPIMPFNGP